MEKTLVIMAAGMGSRFGGLKQIEPVGPSKEIIADYSVYDAYRAGFEKVIFIIREEHLDYFKENITKKYEGKIKIDFAFQKLENVIEGTKIPEGRVKMWGTTHAIYSAKDLIKGPFMVINADDFYGENAFKMVSQFFDENKVDQFIVTYPIKLVSSANGAVKRGVCNVIDNELKDIKECEIFMQEHSFLAKTLDGTETFEIEENQPVSMNCFGFQASFLQFIENDFKEFCHQELDEKIESLLPDTVRKNILNSNIKMYYKNSLDKWLGITYKEDLALIQTEILKLVNNGVYPQNLWRD